MSLLRSKSTRVFVFKAGSLTDATEGARVWGLPSVPADVATTDSILLARPHKFNYQFLAIQTANSNGGSLTAEYWNGSAWVAFTDFTDETAGMATDGFITWEEKKEWVKSKPALIPELSTLTFQQEMFFIRLKMTVTASAGTAIRAVKMLLSDDRLMKITFPEIMKYLPRGTEAQTDWYPQHELAADEIVNELITMGMIAYPEQLKNPEDWILAATYKCIEIILRPIRADEELAKVKEEFAEKSKSALTLGAASIDLNKTEDLEPAESEPQNDWNITVHRR